MAPQHEQLALFDLDGTAVDHTEPFDLGWRHQALGAIGRLARNRGHFSVDDLRRVVGEPDEAYQWGPIFLAAQRNGLIEAVDVRPAGATGHHAELVHVWRGRASAGA